MSDQQRIFITCYKCVTSNALKSEIAGAKKGANNNDRISN